MSGGAKQKILVVDDQWPVRSFIANLLQREGFEVLEAVDGLDALELLQQMGGAVDVLVTDVNMPRMTGIELLERVKAEFAALPVVFISSDPVKEQIEMLGRPSSRVLFLQKPFRPQAILGAIRAMIADSGAAHRFGA